MAMASAASRLLRIGSSSLVRLYRNASVPLHSFSPPLLGHVSYPPTLRLRPSSSLLRPLSQTSLPRIEFYCSGSTTASVDDAESTASSPSHPWPEWELFLEKLKSKGYFEKSSSTEAAGDAECDTGSAASTISMDLNRVKAACLSFARERFDILRFLPKEDIQAVVECGCPNLFRKAVNSAKRLRAYLRLDEGDVCSACNLRGSCDKAYVIAKEDEGARTVDIVRILLSYAADPLVLSVGEKPQVREHVEGSVRRLLSELIKLTDTTPDPGLPKPAVKPPTKKEQSQNVLGLSSKQSQNVEMKRGDWICSKCNFMNFARNVRCLECKEDGPKRVSFDDAEMKKGDWTCLECQFMNFARNTVCLRCQNSRPSRQLNPGEWECLSCQFMNFARNTVCLRCQKSRPSRQLNLRQLNPGEWECPSCDFLNFRRNMVCLKCNCERPKDESTQYEDQIWRRPKVAPGKNLSDFGDDEDDLPIDDILPLREGDNKFAANKRASPAERRFTSARKQKILPS